MQTFQTYVVIVILLAAWFVSAMSQKENMIDPTDPAAKARCVKLAGKPTWSKFYFRRRLPNGKCHRGWEGTWCADGMGKQYQNKQCRRKHRVAVPAPVPAPAPVVVPAPAPIPQWAATVNSGVLATSAVAAVVDDTVVDDTMEGDDQ